MDAYDIEIYKGSSFSLSITVKDENETPINLTNYNLSGFIRYNYSNDSLLASLNASKTAPYTGGAITLSIAPSGTSALPVGLCPYDVEILNTGDGTITKVLRGKALIYPEATY